MASARPADGFLSWLTGLLPALFVIAAIGLSADARAQGATLWSTTFGCSGCHNNASSEPDNLRRNTGSTRAVLDQAISINAG